MNLFLQSYSEQMVKIKRQGDLTLQQLTADEMYIELSNNSNSIEVLVQHIAGNIRSRSVDFLTTDGEKPTRVRSEEFIPSKQSKEQIIELWEDAWTLYENQIQQLTTDHLDAIVTIQQKELTVTEALMTQIVHYAGHIAQMMYVGKCIKQQEWEPVFPG